MNENAIMICTQCGGFEIGADTPVCHICGGTLANTNVTTAETQHLSTEEFMKWRADMLKEHSPGYETFLKDKASKNSEKKVDMSSYIPKCPTCGCPYIRRLGGHENNYELASRLGNSNLAFKTFICLNCGYAW